MDPAQTRIVELQQHLQLTAEVCKEIRAGIAQMRSAASDVQRLIRTSLQTLALSRETMRLIDKGAGPVANLEARGAPLTSSGSPPLGADLSAA